MHHASAWHFCLSVCLSVSTVIHLSTLGLLCAVLKRRLSSDIGLDIDNPERRAVENQISSLQ